MRRLLVILIAVILCTLGYSQSNNSLPVKHCTYCQKGDYYIERYEFKKAIVFYNRAFKNDSTDFYSILKKAEAYTKLNLPKQAEECYRIAIENNPQIESDFLLKYALSLHVNEKYAESKIWLNKYNNIVKNDIRVDNYITSIENQNQLYKDSTIQIVENVLNLNTNESEINPIHLNDKIIFASSRVNTIDAFSNGYYDIFSAEVSSSGEILKVNSFNNSINTSFHEGPLAINGSKSLVFFTRNISQKDNRNKVKLGIYETSVPEDAKDQLIISAISIDNFEHNMGHPALNHDATILYFISNPPESIGGLDIYKSVKSNGSWSFPENLGDAINTKGNEMFPFLFNDSVLYFASDGHGGLGGLDLFKVNLNKEPFQIINLGYPINSNSDDFSLFQIAESQTGYFCSNRPGGKGSDDIYRYDIINFKIKGDLVDANSKALLEDAKIRLLKKNGEEFLITKSSEGEFEFSIIPGESYTLIIEKEDYKAEEIFFNEDMTLQMRKHMLIGLNPLQRAEIKLDAGQKYNFTSGNILKSSIYNIELDKIVSEFSSQDDSITNVTVLNKQMLLAEGDIYTMQLLRDPSAINLLSMGKETLLLFNSDTLSFTDDSILFALPAEKETQFTLKSDLDYISQNYSNDKISLQVDNGPILSDKAAAINELEYLMSLSINIPATQKEDSAVKVIAAKNFSIIPRLDYILTVGKKDLKTGLDVKLDFPLTQGVKYDFSSNSNEMADYRTRLDSLLETRKDIQINTEEAIDISLLSKDLKMEDGEEFIFSLQVDSNKKDTKDSDIEMSSTILLDNRTFEFTSKDKFQINIPYNPERSINIQTDIDYLQGNYKADEYILDLDTTAFFSEIVVDTTGYFNRFRSENDMRLSSDKTAAINELEYLMSLSINIPATQKEDSAVKVIAAKNFSIIPRLDYILTVGKKDLKTGLDVKLDFPLTQGVKYDFSSNSNEMADYRIRLDSLLETRKDIQINTEEAIDISLLSKDLKMEDGEEFIFSLQVDSNKKDTKDSDIEMSSTILLDNRTFEFTSKDKFQINIPYNPERSINIQTDIDYLQGNYKADEYILDLDTTAFFSEIVVDTTGYFNRFRSENDMRLSSDKTAAINELEYLMSLSINIPATQKEDSAVKVIAAKNFSIIPRLDYILTVGKKDLKTGLDVKLDFPLTQGVKYDFSSNSNEMADYRIRLDSLLETRKDIQINTEEAIDISLLSKDLKMEDGEEFIFSLQVDSNKKDTKDSDIEMSSTILLDNRTFEFTSKDKFQINIPYNPERSINIQTDIDYLQDNFNADEYNLDLDTTAFFSEIVVDTTGYYKLIGGKGFENSDEHFNIGGEEDNISNSSIGYRVQIAASRKIIPKSSLQKRYSGNLEIKNFEEDGWQKYYIADVPTYFEAKQILNNCGVKGAFIVAYKEGNKVALRDAMSIQYKERMENSGQLVGDSIINVVTVNFEFDNFELRSDEEKYLQELVIKRLKENENTYITINGHTDIRGSDVYNYGLSKERSEIVKALIISYGISENRIKTFSFGESQVLKACERPVECDESVHQVNRRVEIVLFLPKN